jgi:hypothetical protein
MNAHTPCHTCVCRGDSHTYGWKQGKGRGQAGGPCQAKTPELPVELKKAPSSQGLDTVHTLRMLTLPVTRVYVEEIAIHMGGSKGKGVARRADPVKQPPQEPLPPAGPVMQARVGEQLRTVSTYLAESGKS